MLKLPILNQMNLSNSEPLALRTVNRKVLYAVTIILLLLLPVRLPLLAAEKDQVLKTQANMMVELTFYSSGNYTDPFNQVTLDAIFTDPDGHELRVPGFWDGNNKWKVRFSSPVTGTHRFLTVCSEPGDKRLNGVAGEVKVQSYKGNNLLLRHGALRVADDKRHFVYGDGTPFFWLGDTWWMGLTKRLAWPEDFKTLAADRSKKGFNVIQIVAGLYPEMNPFDEAGENEAGFPWERDYSRIRPEYFDAADRRIMFLVEQGFVPCIVGAWGFHLPWLGGERMKKHWRYIIARWGALPVIWVAAGEVRMPFYKSTTQIEDESLQINGWTDIIRYMHTIDPYHRLITTHPTRYARHEVTDPSVLDFEMNQGGHSSTGPGYASLALECWQEQPTMPVMCGESCYEALVLPTPLPAAAARQAFWAHNINSGFAGHTYGANGIWQVNTHEHPYDSYPHSMKWGNTPWDEAMNLPGSTQLSFARRLIESLPLWYRLEPRPELVASDSAKMVPICAAAGDKLRVVYIFTCGTVKLLSLMPGARYTAAWFNPITGEKLTDFILIPDSEGNSSATSPAIDQDWVLTLKRKL